jgi:hypothetical protein
MCAPAHAHALPTPNAPPSRAQTCKGAHRAHTARYAHQPRSETHHPHKKTSHAAPARGTPTTADQHRSGRAHAATQQQPRSPGRAAPSTRGAAPSRAASPGPDRAGPAKQQQPATSASASGSTEGRTPATASASAAVAAGARCKRFRRHLLRVERFEGAPPSTALHGEPHHPRLLGHVSRASLKV